MGLPGDGVLSNLSVWGSWEPAAPGMDWLIDDRPTFPPPPSPVQKLVPRASGIIKDVFSLLPHFQMTAGKFEQCSSCGISSVPSLKYLGEFGFHASGRRYSEWDRLGTATHPPAGLCREDHGLPAQGMSLLE